MNKDKKKCKKCNKCKSCQDQIRRIAEAKSLLASKKKKVTDQETVYK